MPTTINPMSAAMLSAMQPYGLSPYPAHSILGPISELTRALADRRQLITEMAFRLLEAAPDNPIFANPEVQKVLIKMFPELKDLILNLDEFIVAKPLMESPYNIEKPSLKAPDITIFGQQLTEQGQRRTKTPRGLGELIVGAEAPTLTLPAAAASVASTTPIAPIAPFTPFPPYSPVFEPPLDVVDWLSWVMYAGAR
jgi:hypothetical protein